MILSEFTGGFTLIVGVVSAAVAARFVFYIILKQQNGDAR